MSTHFREDLFIGGEWRPASNGARFSVLDPATGGHPAHPHAGAVAIEQGIVEIEHRQRGIQLAEMAQIPLTRRR